MYPFLNWHNFFFSVILIFVKNIIADGKHSFPLVMVGGVLEANKRWDIGKEVVKCIVKDYPGAVAIRPKVSIFYQHSYLYSQLEIQSQVFACLSSLEEKIGQYEENGLVTQVLGLGAV